VAKDPSKLSRNPNTIRARLRRGGVRVERDLEILAEVQGKDYKPIEEWDFEELAHGKPRNKKGGFNTGPKPQWINPVIVEEVSRRLRNGFIDETRKALPDVLKVLLVLLKDDESPRIQLDAAKLFLEYAIGLPEKRISIEASSRVEHLLADVIVLDDGRPAHPVIDGQFHDDDEDDEEEDDRPKRR
jgi:hypothetical protein